jgi:predicted cobalt transporter CbtA
MVAGLVAGVVAFAAARLFGESSVAQAIAVEGAHAAGHHTAEGPEVVSRSIQSTIGLLTATTVFGIGLGGIFALVFGALQGRVALRARGLAGVLALAGFVVIYLVPFVKYPPNPPAVGDPGTIGRRTGLYFTMLALSVLVAVLAVLAARALESRIGTWNAVVSGGLLFVCAAGLVSWAMPVINEVGSDFPAATLYQFRLASVGVQLALWTTIGLVFGALTDRSLRSAAGQSRERIATPV